jgi:hypothetical protein
MLWRDSAARLGKEQYSRHEPIVSELRGIISKGHS